MPRGARQKSPDGIYHILMRGIPGQSLFADDSDYTRFLQILCECRKIGQFRLLAYCLADSHVHLLIKEGSESLGRMFKRIGARYVSYYNRRHFKNGPLFRDRYKSEPVNDGEQLVEALRFIHSDPQRNGHDDDYVWCSLKDYHPGKGLADVEYAKTLSGTADFFESILMPCGQHFLDLKNPPVRLSDEELSDVIRRNYGIEPSAIRGKSNEILKQLLALDGVSTRQLSRVTGISCNFIWKL